MDKLLVSAGEAAEMLSISRSHLYAQVGCGRIARPIKVGKKSLWSVEQLQSWVQAEIEKLSRGKIR